MDYQIIILAAGKGTRMNSDQPKVLVDLNGRPLIGHLVKNLSNFADLTNLVFVIGHKRDHVQDYLGDQYTYAIQDEQLGTGHAVLCAKPQITADNVIILYGDMPFIKSSSLKRLFAEHKKQQAHFSMFTTKVPNFENEYEAFSNFGRIIRANGEIIKIQEYKNASESEKKILEVNPGIYICNSKWLWDALTQVRQNNFGEYFLTDLVEIASKYNTPILNRPIDPMEVYGINTPAQLEIAKGLET